MRENMILPYLEEVTNYGHIGVVLVVHLVQTLDAYAVELADGIERFARLYLVPIALVLFGGLAHPKPLFMSSKMRSLPPLRL